MCTLPKLSVSLMIGASTAGKLTNAAGRAVSGEILYSQDEKLEADRRDRICVSISSSPQQGQKACCIFPVPWLHSMQRSEGQAWTRQMNSGWELVKGPRQGEQGLQPRKEGASASTSGHQLHALKLEKSPLREISKHNLSHPSTNVCSSSEHFSHLVVPESPVFDAMLRLRGVYCTPTVYLLCTELITI